MSCVVSIASPGEESRGLDPRFEPAGEAFKDGLWAPRLCKDGEAFCDCRCTPKSWLWLADETELTAWFTLIDGFCGVP